MSVAGPSQPTTITAYRHDQGSLNYDKVASSVCGGCSKTIGAETEGVVVAFGSSLWHTDCFRCAKCGDQVNADSTLLLLGDGHPICSNCSYVCNVCNLQIQDEAIMAGQDAFHAACFTCKTCHKRIEESVFAKASHGIYCMDCHNDRVARTRRHAERRQAKSRSQRTKTAGGSREPTPRTPLSRELPRFNLEPQPRPQSSYALSITSPPEPHGVTDDTYSFSISQPSTQQVPQDVAPGQDLLDQTILITQPPPQLHYPADEIPWNPSPVDIDNDTMSFADMQDSVILLHSTEDQLPTTERASMLSVPLPNVPGERRRKHYDEGVRPLQAFFGKQQQQTLLSPASPISLSIPSGLDIPGHTPKSEKRRSINPIYKPSTPNQPSNDGSHSVRSPSPDSMHTAYYSPAVSPDDGRSSPLREAQNHSRSRSPSPFANHSYSVPHLAIGDEERIETPPSSRSFPPRGKSLPSSQPLSKTASSASTSTIRPLPKIRPSVPSQTPSSHSRDGSLPSNDSPPSPKGDVEDPVDSPHSPAFSDNSESALQNSRLLEAPALPPMRFSSGPEKFTGFAADILKVVSDSEPRVPRPRDSGVLTKSLTQSPDGGLPPSPSQEAARRITSLIPESKSTPIVPRQHSGSSWGSEGSLRIRKDSDASIPNSVSQPSTPNHSHAHSFHQAQSPSESTPIVARPPRKSSSASDHLNGGMLGESYNSLSNGSVVSLVPSLRPSPSRNDPGDLAGRRLREALNDATARRAKSVKLDPELAEAVLKALDGTKEMYSGLKGDMDQIKRTSHQYMTGFSVAQEEYQKEVAARKDLQAEVTRLRVQLSGQAARLTAMSAEQRTRTSMEKHSLELGNQIVSLEHEIAKLRVDRDMALAEIEELVGTRKSVLNGNSADLTSNISRALSTRLDYVKSQYRKELEPLQERRERLFKEVTELREARDIFLEETTALNSRNEQLADLNAQIANQIQSTMAEAGAQSGNMPQLTADASALSIFSESASLKSSLRGKRNDQRSGYASSVFSFNTAASTTLEGSEETGRFGKVGKTDPPEPHTSKKFKWFRDGVMTVGKTPSPMLPPPEKVKRHNFISANLLRIVRCDQCGDKLWGAQLRCTNCHLVCHTRCGAQVKGPCKHNHIREESTDIVPLAPSMFGRDLIEQVHADAQGGSRDIPIIVEKCIEAVEVIGLDYEGIYRKTGGSSQSKAITQLFERGRYEAFDLLDTDVFNDISSVTSVLKNYFRTLPNPLLTFDLHDQFVNATGIKDPRDKLLALSELVHQLPREHYCTLRALMIHLNRIRLRSDENLMTARNLGVVFGPTLMRSRDPTQEFADMAGKALSVEFLVDNAPIVFQDPHP